jgi:hypothetical protein
MALDSPDLEVARRVSSILDAFDRRKVRRAVDRFRALAKAGAIDQLAEYFVRWPHADEEDACWQITAELAAHLYCREKEVFQKTSAESFRQLPWNDFSAYKESEFRPKRLTSGRNLPKPPDDEASYMVRAEEIILPYYVSGCMIVAPGTVNVDNERPHRIFGMSILLSGNSVELDEVAGSIIVCDGDFTAKGGLDSCLVIARGNVYLSAERTRNCRIITSGKIHVPKRAELLDTTIKEDEPVPLGFVRFFDLAILGVVFDQGANGVRVKKVEMGRAFDRAHVHSGDIIATADGKEVASADAFRRLLRRKFVFGESLTLTVQRNGNMFDVVVSCRE